MEIRVLKYVGPMTDGTVIVRQEKLMSPYRNLKVFKGMELEVGRDIPETTARYITDMMAHSFKVEVIQLDNNAEVKHNIVTFLEGYKERFGKDASAALPALTVEAIFDLFGKDAIESILQAMSHSRKVGMAVEDISKRLLAMSDVEPSKEAPPTKPPKREEAEEVDQKTDESKNELGEKPPKPAAKKPPKRMAAKTKPAKK